MERSRGLEMLGQRGGILVAVCVLLFGGAGFASASSLPIVTPVMSCGDLLNLDFASLEGAPTKLDSATLVTQGTPLPYCAIKGYVAPSVHFELHLPTQGWTQRFLMQGCGGYCGSLILSLTNYLAPSASNGCAPAASGELATAAHDGGHVGALNTTFFLQSIGDGLWAIDNPGALLDFFYKSNHKVTVAAKALIEAFYGQPAQYSYFDGCSSGGRAALHVAQRYPEDYNGILAGAPTIDNTATNTFSHAWNVRVNMAENGTAILTSDKIPALAQAVQAKCGDGSGVILDPRRCHFDARSLICAGGDAPSCLTPAQAQAANLIYQGPVDQRGTLLAPGGMPYGSELAWVGSMVLGPGQVFSTKTSSDFVFSYDFPNYMSNWFVTGITNQNMEFTKKEFEFLDTMAGLNDPTNPDLREFAGHGGKLLIWQGWADSGTSPFGTLNYFSAVRHFMGAHAASEFMALYMIPGVYHCAGGPNPAQVNFLTPLMQWVEDRLPPGQQTVYYQTGAPRQVSPYISKGVDDVLDWAGLKHYRSGEQVWCEQDGTKLVCKTEKTQHRNESK